MNPRQKLLTFNQYLLYALFFVLLVINLIQELFELTGIEEILFYSVCISGLFLALQAGFLSLFCFDKKLMSIAILILDANLFFLLIASLFSSQFQVASQITSTASIRYMFMSVISIVAGTLSFKYYNHPQVIRIRTIYSLTSSCSMTNVKLTSKQDH